MRGNNHANYSLQFISQKYEYYRHNHIYAAAASIPISTTIIIRPTIIITNIIPLGLHFCPTSLIEGHHL